MVNSSAKNHSRAKVWAELEAEKNSIYCHSSAAIETFVPEHSHNRSQLIYSEGGRVYVTAENRIWYLPARHYMWIPAGVKHSIRISMPSVLLWFIYFPVWKKEAPFFKRTGIYPVTDLLLGLMDYTRKWKGHITRDSEERFFLISGIKALLPEISRNKLLFGLPLPSDNRLEGVIDYLHRNLSKTIKIRQVAKKFGMSESTLGRLFKKDLEMSFTSYLGTLRILRSIELLAMGKMTMKEICYQVGYESVPTFSNIFKKIVGSRPTSYLREG